MTEQEKIVVKIDSDLEDLIPGFLENRQKDVITLNEALANGKFETLQSVGHSLKGVGGGYGFDRLSEIGAEIEIKAKAGVTDGLDELIASMHDYLERLEVEYE